MRTHEIAVLPIETERRDLDSLRFLAVNSTISAVHQYSPDIPYYGPEVNSSVRGETWQNYAHQLALEGRSAIEQDARILHPCQSDIASAIGKSALGIILNEQDLRFESYARTLPDEIVARAAITPDDEAKVLSMAGYEWLQQNHNNRTLSSVIGQIAFDVLFAKTLVRLRHEKTVFVADKQEVSVS